MSSLRAILASAASARCFQSRRPAPTFLLKWFLTYHQSQPQNVLLL